jgi:two-component system, NtrC family, nitrogen regulation response regulator NtrX
MAQDILIVDDERDIRALVSGILTDEGMTTREAANSDEALQAVRTRQPSMVILDIWLQNSKLDGLQILDTLQKEHPLLPVVMISGHGNIETAVSAIKKGAYDFIEKPFDADRLLLVVKRALEAARLRRENAELKLKAGGEAELTGTSAAVTALRGLIERVAPTNSRVLITGPSGSGKEVTARLIHANSKRADGPFVVANCATMRADTFEHELFGTEAGFNGNPSRKIGLFEQAHGGTLFLDEVADMPLETQGKIVRLLHDQSFERMGGTKPVQVDVRVVASTTHDLPQEIQARRFREDLYYRLSVVPVVVPPLRDRREDVPVLARDFMKRAAAASGLPTREFGEDALAAMQTYEWPGNVRQLRNVAEWLLIMTPADAQGIIRADQLPPELGSSTPAVLKWEKGGEIMALPLREARELFEREYLLAQVTRFGGNISRTSNFVGMERSALHRKLKSLGIGNERGERTANINHPVPELDKALAE